MQIRSVGIDLGKTTFHLVALGTSGKVLAKKKFSQKQLLAFTANMQTSLIGLEACSGAHFLGRALKQQGHDVRLIAAQFVKPFVKSNKNDFVDAEAIARLSNGRTCASSRSRPTINWTCRRCTGFVIDLSPGAQRSSTR
jgi:transposase